MNQTEDRHIVRMLCSEHQGDSAVEMLVSKYGQRLYWHLRRLVVSHEDAQDLLQETMIKAYSNIGSLKSASKLQSWLYRIATNEALQMLRQRQLHMIQIEEGEGERLTKMLYQCEPMCEQRLVMLLTEAILTLPQSQRLVFNMRYYDELSYRDIARIMDCSVASLKTSYHYAQQKVKEYMLNNM